MTLKEWLDFNQPLLNCDLLVKMLKNGSYHNQDCICELYLGLDYAKKLFGSFELKKVSVGKIDGLDHTTIKVVIWD